MNAYNGNFVNDIITLAKGGFLPNRCWILDDGIHTPHLYYTKPKISQDRWELPDNPTDFPLWIKLRRIYKRRGQTMPERCLLLVEGRKVTERPIVLDSSHAASEEGGNNAH